MNSFLTALMFLTKIPLPRFHGTKDDWYKSAIYFPIIGLMIGVLLLLVYLVLEAFFSNSITALFIVFFWIWITGGLHIDGWIDLSDAIGSNRSQEHMLEIMKDSRIGAMGAIAAICLIVGKIIAVYEIVQHLPIEILLISPFFARISLIGAIKFGNYRKEGGLGEGLSTYLTPFIIFVHAFIVLSITYLILQLKGISLLFLTIFVNMLFLWYIYRKLKVLTGDCYGALVEWSEAATLFSAILLWGLF